RAIRGVGTARAGRRRRVQRLRGLLQRLRLRLDLALVVALHGRLEVRERRLDRADLRAVDLGAVLLDRAAGRVDQAVRRVARGDQVVELLVFLAIGLGVADPLLDLFLGPA